MRDYNKGCRIRMRKGIKEIHVDTDIAEYLGIKWKDLGSWGRRKYENFLFLANNTERNKIVFYYKP